MRKFIFFILAATTFAIVINAQIRVKKYGQLQVGQESSDVSTIPSNRKDTISRIQVFGPCGDMGEGARITFGDAALTDNLNVLIGELGTTDCDKLWLHGKRGTYITATSNAEDTIAFFDAEKGRYFQFNCDVKTTGIFVRSDARFKENILPLTCSDKLCELTAVSYKLKSNATPQNDRPRAVSSASFSDKETRDNEFFRQYYQNLQNQPTRFGFIAQEVKEVYPELVHTDSLGNMYVDYLGMIPLLVNAVKELKERSDSLEFILSKTTYTELPQLTPVQKASIENLTISTCKLYQNSPNPFNFATEIKCDIPEPITNAEILIFDIQGTLKLKKTISSRGKTFVTINANELSPGMYIYALIIDGQERESKRMILTD